MALIVWVHNLVYRLAFGLVRLAAWLVRLALMALGKWVLVLVNLLGEEFRRYAGLALSGAAIVLLGKLILSVPEIPGKRWVVLADLLFLAVWAMAVRRSVKHTMRNNMERVRARTRQKKLAGEVSAVYERVPEMLARKAWGTPLEGAWSSNRSARIEEQAAAQRAAEQAAENAERDRMTQEDDDRERDRLAELEPNPYK